MRNVPLLLLIVIASCAPPSSEPSTEKAVAPPGETSISSPLRQTAIKPFRLDDVRLLDGPFKVAQEANTKYMLSLDPDRLLHRFRTGANLKPKAPLYEGWAAKGVSGHVLGHYLSACAMNYAATEDKRFLDRIDYIVSELAECQRAIGSGYVGGPPRGQEIFNEIASGDIRAKPFFLNDCWAFLYTVHKLFAGLWDAYDLCDHEQAREVLIKLTNFLEETTRDLTDEQVQEMLICEHGGFAEILANVWSITDDPRHLKLARRFCSRAVLDPLSRREDKLPGSHANYTIPVVISAARLHELTGEEYFETASEYFWETMVGRYSYVTGGNAEAEYYFPPDEFEKHLTTTASEKCGTYNMLKLTRHLFLRDGAAKKFDYYERGLYNNILPAQDPKTGCTMYHVSFQPAHFKIYSHPTEAFWCCTGTSLEDHAKYGDSIYFHSPDTLYVNLFIPSKLRWRDKGVTVTQETTFPEEETTRLTIGCDVPTNFALKIRKPFWTDAMEVRVNGELAGREEEGFIVVNREWHDGDRVEARMPMRLRVEALPHSKRWYAILHGPTLLAGKMGREGLDGVDRFRHEPIDLQDHPGPEIPAFSCTPEEMISQMKPVAGQPQTFRFGNTTLIPFYKLRNDRYSIYWEFEP